jgi:hypothetical protein
MLVDILSSHVHVIFIPPVHFSNVSVHRGTITMFVADGVVPVLPIMPGAPGMPIPMPARSIIIALVIMAVLAGVSLPDRPSARNGRYSGHHIQALQEA